MHPEFPAVNQCCQMYFGRRDQAEINLTKFKNVFIGPFFESGFLVSQHPVLWVIKFTMYFLL